ncbi:kinase-like domain-containing protein, partial [Irpex lacteus]
GAYWLLEPMRHTLVKRYSGTMDHINREHGKDALTINAFAHFAYIYSGKEIVFADIQAQISTRQGLAVRTLFDIMSHTPEGNSSVGDHGQEGIDTYEAQHECTEFCIKLSL